MHRKKGKWVVSNKDTWWTGNLLSPVILAYLTKFKSVAENAMGVPMYYVEKQAQIQGVDAYAQEADLEAARKLRLADIDELIYIFNEDNSPEKKEYNYTCEFVPFEEGGLRGTIQVSNQAEADRYTKDMREWDKRQQAGFKLFGEIYSTLDD